MSAAYFAALSALIDHVQQLKDKGVRRLPISRELLLALAQPARSRISAANLPARRVETMPTSTCTPTPNPGIESPSAPQTPASTPLPPSVPSVKAQSAGDKSAAMAALRERALVCQKCSHLVRSRKNVVFGVGDINSPILFVGEAPGVDEDEQGEPFVGAAGQLLTRIIQTMGFSRETVYIANILKCRPDTPGRSFGNRKPTPEEIKTCLPYLLAQVDLIQPKVIVALGAVAMEGLFGRTVYITKERGRFVTFRNTPVMPTYHPSYLLRKQGLETKREVWEDMLQVLELLNLPISDKQRAYFLKAG